MRCSRCAWIAHFWGLLVVLSSGCNEQPASEPTARVQRSSALPAAAIAAPETAEFRDSTKGTSQGAIASASSARALSGTPGLRQPARGHHVSRDGRLFIALDDHTVMGQPLPRDVEEHWRTEIHSLGDGYSSLIKVVTDPAKADWLVQVAAVERTDIVYVTPSRRDSEQIDDERLIMLPPGQPARASLKAQLESIARAANLIEFAEQDDKNREGRLKLEVELRRIADASDPIGEKLGPASILHEGTSIGFQVKNPNPFPVWVTVLFVDSHHRIHALFPRPSESTGRLEASGRSGDACLAVRGTIDAAGKGLERLIVLAVEEKAESASPDFTFLTQPAPAAVRSEQSSLQQLMTAAVFRDGERSLNEKAEFEQPVEKHAFHITGWPTATHREATRGALGFFREGSAEDLKAEIIKEQNGDYHTANRTQAVLGTYGKLVKGNKVLGRLHRFEHRGLIQHLDRVPRFATVHRRGRDTGKDFLSFLGNRHAWQVVDLAGKVSGGRHQEVEFEVIGTRLDQNEAIRALNADAEALRYFAYLRENGEIPCVVLENIVMANYAASTGAQLNLQGSATAITSEGVGAQVDRQRESSMQLMSPVIRCYQMCEVKQRQNQVVELTNQAP